MSISNHWLPGHFPIAARSSVSLEPRLCGELKIGAGHVAANARPLAPGDKLRLWAGDRVDLVNRSVDSPALYSWNLCSDQPPLRERVRRSLERLAQRFGAGVPQPCCA